MDDILIISPFSYALKKKHDDVKFKFFCKEVANYKIHAIQALPEEVPDKLKGKTFDFAYIDTEYIDDEISEIRSHITGDQSKRIKFF